MVLVLCCRMPLCLRRSSAYKWESGHGEVSSDLSQLGGSDLGGKVASYGKTGRAGCGQAVMVTVIEVAIGQGAAPTMFQVEVVASPAGEASAVVELDPGALLARRGLLQQAVLASAVSGRQVLPEAESPIREVGELLFAGLLGAGEVAGQYRAAAALAARRGQGLRVVLRINSPVLAGLPWEAMYDQGVGAYVCRRDQLVRHVPVASVPAPLQVRPPLRILGVVSSPRELFPVGVEKEQDQLARALARPVGLGLAEVHWAATATWADLQDLLLDGEWHVLHFIGHSSFDPVRDEGTLALTREDGRADPVAAHRLVDLLRQARPMPRLVVLNSCSGAAAGVSDMFSSTAAALVRGGVSAVAAMQYEVSDSAAVAFARGFYAAIARGRGVDDAVSSGRAAILGLSDRTLEWVTPVLYLRGNDTRLFTFPAPAADTNREGTASVRTRRSTVTAEKPLEPGPWWSLSTAAASRTVRIRGEIGLWGPPKSGKKTFIASLSIAVDRSRRDMSISGDNDESADLLAISAHALTKEQQFPSGAMQAGAYRWSVDLGTEVLEPGRWGLSRQDKTVDVRARFNIDLLDASGGHFTGQEPRPQQQGLDLGGDPPQEEMRKYLASHDGLLLLIDPVREQKLGDAYEYFQDTLAGAAQRLKEAELFGSRLPHYVAVCITKFDDPAVYGFARDTMLCHPRVDDPYRFPFVHDHDAETFFRGICQRSPVSEAELLHSALHRYFRPDRIRYFITSAIGFYADRRGEFRDNDPQNVIESWGGGLRIRGQIHPLNVLEPVLWLGQNLARDR
jgi:CHAT domain